MDEKIIIQSKNTNAKLIRNVIFGVGPILGIIAALLYADSRKQVHNAYCGYYEMLSFSEYIEKYPDDLFGIYGMLCFAGAVIAALAIGGIFYYATHKIELTITDKRVYGVATFGKRVDLPLDSVSSVGTGHNKIAVATSSGKIVFWGIKNYEEIHKSLSALLVERQNKTSATTTIKQEIPQSNADELKKYKELLDSGVITQEEFDAKKKQLLGL